MLTVTANALILEGPGGSLSAPASDVVLRKLAMLFEGECEGVGPTAAADKFGFSRQRYFQLRQLLQHGGVLALCNQKRGPKTHYRRTDQVIQQVVRHRFLDPDASAEVIAQKLRQSGFPVSTRSVERVLAEFGLQKKTLPVSSRAVSARGPGASHQEARTRRPRRS
jgi:transposase